MSKFSQALLMATYKEGRLGKLTEAHDKAEHHRFKTELLFKEKKISKDLYVSRLIQQYLIIKHVEERLQKLQGYSQNPETPVSAFFELSCLEYLWRTAAIKADLIQLQVDPDHIPAKEIVPATTAYLEQIETYTSLELLSHLITHVAGFMHGGLIIARQYIKPSNALTQHQISTHQYDFFKAGKSAHDVYQEMMTQLDKPELSEQEYEAVKQQGENVYVAMTRIYDDLYTIHAHQPQQTSVTQRAIMLTALFIGMALLAHVLTRLFNELSPDANPTPGPTL